MTKRGKRGHVMKAIAVYPAKPHSTHLEDVPMPKVTDIPNGQGVLVKVLRVGVDGTDKEINAAEYGNAPEGEKFLITGHENFGQVMEVGPNVPDTITPGTYVVAMVRRPGHSIYDQIGLQDMTIDNVYYERGINLRHGYLTEYYVEDAAYMVTLPDTLCEVGERFHILCIPNVLLGLIANAPGSSTLLQQCIALASPGPHLAESGAF